MDFCVEKNRFLRDNKGMKDINTDEFELEVLKAKGPVLVDFNAEWCGPCRMQKPILGVVAKQHPEIKVIGINIDNNQELAKEYQISTIPCIIAFKDGKQIARAEGVLSEKKLLKMVEEK